MSDLVSSQQLPVFSLDFVAPERVLTSRDVVMVTIPGVDGDFGVLAGHAPLVSNLRAGVVRIANDTGQDIPSERYFVSGGVAEVSADHCIILAEQAMPLAEIDEKAVSRDIASLREQISAGEGDLQEALLDLRIAEAMLEALRYRGK